MASPGVRLGHARRQLARAHLVKDGRPAETFLGLGAGAFIRGQGCEKRAPVLLQRGQIAAVDPDEITGRAVERAQFVRAEVVEQVAAEGAR
jgi:hypothetical protein